MPWMGPVLGAFMAIGLVGLVVWIWALVDCLQVPDDSMYRTGTKLIWVLVILLAQSVGVMATPARS